MQPFKLMFFIILVFYMSMATDIAQSNRTNRAFKAGASLSNITPFLGAGIVRNYGTPPPAAYIHDQLYAKTLVLDDGAVKLVFVIVDNIADTLLDLFKQLQ